MLIDRDIKKELVQLMNEYPIVTITGPRQSGKTTLSKMVFPEFTYCNLENLEQRKLAQEDPNSFFERYKTPLIIDEVYNVPELLSNIQAIVDEAGENGMFVLTGSHQHLLNERVSQSLAGRTALLTLLPLSINELKNAKIKIDRDDLIHSGFMPRVYKEKQNPFRASRNYLKTYVERDLRSLINVKDVGLFEDFLKLIAGRIGQLVNLNAISNDIGVSSTTLKQWLQVLEISHIVFFLRPYYNNFGKRIIKSPKVYFNDTAVACYLLGIENSNMVHRDPLLGGLFENLVISEAVKTRYNMGLDPNLYFYRDNNGNEIDLIFKKHDKLIPIEIKAAKTYNSDFLKGIKYFQKISGSLESGYVIYSGDLELNGDNYKVRNFKKCHEIFH